MQDRNKTNLKINNDIKSQKKISENNIKKPSKHSKLQDSTKERNKQISILTSDK